MRLKVMGMLMVVLVVLVSSFACSGDDDDGSGNGGDEPTATAGAPDDGNGGDDDGDGGDEVADARGEGTVVIGDQTFEFPVERCLIENGETVIIAGPTTADGQPAYVEVEYHGEFPDPVPDVEVAVGVTEHLDMERGDPILTGFAEGDHVVEINGGATISFTSPNFHDRLGSIETFDGSVDASCEDP